MQAVSYISINGRLTVIGGYKCGAINNGSVMTKNSIRNQKIVIEITTILTCRLKKRNSAAP